MRFIGAIAEGKIKEAQKEGQFDNLSCAGKPVDLSDYFAMPKQMRIGYSILKNANVILPEVELSRERYRLKQKIKFSARPAEHQKIKRKRAFKTAQLGMLIEKQGGGLK